jgi:dipeptidyl aminopeptidase/acylaminoacyl peptidase
MTLRNLTVCLAAIWTVTFGAVTWVHAQVPTTAATAVQKEPLAIETYGRLPAMSNVALSPSGERLAFVAFDGSKRALFVRTLSGTPLAIAPLGDARLDEVYFAGERFVIFNLLVRTKVDVGRQAYRGVAIQVIDLETKEARPLVKPGQKLWDQIFAWFPPYVEDGHWYLTVAGYEHQRNGLREMDFADYQLDLFRVRLDDGELSLLERGESDVQDWLIDKKEILARLKYNEADGNWRIESGDQHKPILTGQDRFQADRMIGLGATPNSVLLMKQGDNDYFDLVEIDLQSGKTLWSAKSEGNIKQVLLSPESQRFEGYILSASNSPVRMLDPQNQAAVDKALRPFHSKFPTLVAMSSDKKRMIVHSTGGDDSGTYWLVDLTTMKADVLGEDFPRITASRIGPARMITYKAADGLEIEAVLVTPPGREAKGLPVVVLPHGGPQSSDDAGFDWLAQAFASRGYAVLQPNFRGSDDYGVEFRNKGFGEWGRKMQTDLSDGLAYLAAQGIVDPKRACILGGSYGGYAALAGVTLQSGIYRCAVSINGVSDLPDMLVANADKSGGADSSQRYWKAFMGADKPGANLNDLSPARRAAQASAPIMLLHAVDDTVVLFNQSLKMERNLRAAGKPVELIRIPTGEHWLLSEVERQTILRSAIEFVMKHNPPDEPHTGN